MVFTVLFVMIGCCAKKVINNDNVLGASMKYELIIENARTHQVDSLIMADTLPHLDRWPGSVFVDYNTSYMANGFNTIKKLIESGKINEAANFFQTSAAGLHKGTSMTCTSLIHDTSRYDRYLDRAQNKDKYYIRRVDHLIDWGQDATSTCCARKSDYGDVWSACLFPTTRNTTKRHHTTRADN